MCLQMLQNVFLICLPVFLRECLLSSRLPVSFESIFADTVAELLSSIGGGGGGVLLHYSIIRACFLVFGGFGTKVLGMGYNIKEIL